MNLHLVGAWEIERMLGVTRQRVQQLAAAPGFPRPVAELHMGRIWRRRDVERWMELTGRVARPLVAEK